MAKELYLKSVSESPLFPPDEALRLVTAKELKEVWAKVESKLLVLKIILDVFLS